MAGQEITYVKVRSPFGLEECHRGEATRAHRHVWELVSRTVRVDREQMRASRIGTAEDKGSTDVALVPT